MPLQWFSTVHSVYLHCKSTVTVTVLWWGTLPFFFFFFSFEQYSSYSFFCLPFVLIFPFIYIVLLYIKFHNIFIIIEVSISYKSKSNNKIWNCDQLQLKKIFCENVLTLVRWIYKIYRIFGLFKWHCSYSSYRNFFFCLSSVLKKVYIYKNPHIYYYISLIYKKWQYCYSDLILCKHCSGNSALVRHIALFFFFFS